MSEPLRVNPILCTGHGLCAELLPEQITLTRKWMVTG
jgi:TPP-dependent indolepyruvate ferredoxin oxidoreductase alpha subunit